jgi:hypothetical protein
LIQDGQNSLETLQNNGNVEIEVRKEDGNE